MAALDSDPLAKPTNPNFRACFVFCVLCFVLCFVLVTISPNKKKRCLRKLEFTGDSFIYSHRATVMLRKCQEQVWNWQKETITKHCSKLQKRTDLQKKERIWLCCFFAKERRSKEEHALSCGGITRQSLEPWGHARAARVCCEQQNQLDALHHEWHETDHLLATSNSIGEWKAQQLFPIQTCSRNASEFAVIQFSQKTRAPDRTEKKVTWQCLSFVCWQKKEQKKKDQNGFLVNSLWTPLHNTLFFEILFACFHALHCQCLQVKKKKRSKWKRVCSGLVRRKKASKEQHLKDGVCWSHQRNITKSVNSMFNVTTVRRQSCKQHCEMILIFKTWSQHLCEWVAAIRNCNKQIKKQTNNKQMICYSSDTSFLFVCCVCVGCVLCCVRLDFVHVLQLCNANNLWDSSKRCWCQHFPHDHVLQILLCQSDLLTQQDRQSSTFPLFATQQTKSSECSYLVAIFDSQNSHLEDVISKLRETDLKTHCVLLVAFSSSHFPNWKLTQVVLSCSLWFLLILLCECLLLCPVLLQQKQNKLNGSLKEKSQKLFCVGNLKKSDGTTMIEKIITSFSKHFKTRDLHTCSLLIANK